MNSAENTFMNQTGISRVSMYTACPVEMCDRCSTGIKYVHLVVYRDGSVQKYGSECIKKILDNAPDMKRLYNQNAKLLALYQDYVKIFSGPVEDMPRGSEYFNSGLYFVADSNGKDISFGHWFFHPLWDVEKNSGGDRYVVTNVEETKARYMKAIAVDLEKLKAEVTRLEGFLGRVLAKATKSVR